MPDTPTDKDEQPTRKAPAARRVALRAGRVVEVNDRPEMETR